MVSIAVCIEMLFTDRPLVDRVDAAADAGTEGIDFWNAAGKDVGALVTRAAARGITVAAFAVGAPLTDPAQGEQSVQRLREAIATARANGIPHITVTTGEVVAGLDRPAQQAAVVAALRAVAREAEQAGIQLNVEILNTLVDHRGYFLDHMATAVAVIEAVGSSAVRVLYDVYHAQIMEGNLIATIAAHRDLIGYYHVADVPGRFEPGTGEINYRNVFAAIAEGPDRWLGLEFRPRGGMASSAGAVRAALAAFGR